MPILTPPLRARPPDDYNIPLEELLAREELPPDVPLEALPEEPSFVPGRYPGTTGEPLLYSTGAPLPIEAVQEIQARPIRGIQELLGRGIPAAEAIMEAGGAAEQALGETGVGRAFRAVSEPFAGAVTQGLRRGVGPLDASPQRPYPERALTPQETYEQEPLPFVTGLIQEAINPLTYFPGAKLPSVRKAVGAVAKTGGEVAARAGVAGGEAVGRAMEATLRPGARTVAAGRKAKEFSGETKALLAKVEAGGYSTASDPDFMRIMRKNGFLVKDLRTSNQRQVALDTLKARVVSEPAALGQQAIPTEGAGKEPTAISPYVARPYADVLTAAEAAAEQTRANELEALSGAARSLTARGEVISQALKNMIEDAGRQSDELARELWTGKRLDKFERNLWADFLTELEQQGKVPSGTAQKGYIPAELRRQSAAQALPTEGAAVTPEAAEAARGAEGAKKLTQQELQDALLGPEQAPPQTVGARDTAGNIVGAKPIPPQPIPAAGQPPIPRPSREFWARPLANLDMIAGAFKDNFWRSQAQRVGLKQFTSIIDPAALVSGTATDPASITRRALLLRNRVLDVGDSGVNAGMAFLRERPNPFNISVDGRIGALPGKPTWYDVFDNPGRFALSPEQSEYVRLYQDMLDDGLKLAQENDIPIKELTLGADRHYIPRLVEAIRGIENEKAGRVGGRIGAKAGFQKTRFYEWAEEGVAKGVVYSNDPLTVMEHHIQSTYRLLSDKRLADEMASLGETILARVEKTRPGLIAAREISKKEFTRARELLSAVNRAYRGERLPPALVASVGRSFPNEAAALKVAGPNSPALQPIEAAARTFMAQHRTKWKDLSIQMGRAKDAVQPGFDEGWIPQPFGQGRIFPKEVVEIVNRATGDLGNAWLRAVQVPSVISRTIGTTIDFGAPFIQGLGVLGENPGAWARATMKHYHAFLDPAAKQRYFTQNADVVREMAQYGANVGTSEFFAGNRPVAGLLKLLPEEARNVTTWIGRQTVGRFQEAFGTFLDVSAVEMWKGLRDRALQEGTDSLFALADYVSHARGTMSQRTIGVGLSQQQIEGGILMFAPRYTKAGFALFSDIATLPPYLKGNALRANTSAIIGSAVTFFLAGAAGLNALGLMKPEEVQERLQPIRNGRFNSKFLTLPIGTDNVGLGGFGYSLLRLIAGTTDKAINEPGDLLKMDAQDNPIMGFLRSRLVGGAPAMALATELFTGRDYFGQKFDEPLDYAKAVGKRLLPFWAESYLLQEPPASLESAPFAFAGQRVFPQSYGSRAQQLEEQLAQERGWTLPLNRDQRRQLEADNPELAKLKGQAETQSEKFAKDEIQQQTADYFTDIDKSKALRERGLEAPYRGFVSGKLSGKDLLDIRNDANTELAGASTLAREKYPKALVDRAAREAYYAANRIEVKEGNPDDIAAEGYYAIRVPTGEEGKDFDTFFQAREDYLKQFSPEVQNYITKIYPNKRFSQDWMNKLEAEIQRDQETLRPYWELEDTVAAITPALVRLQKLEQDAIAAGDLPRAQKVRAAINKGLSTRKEQLRRKDSGAIDLAGLKWGYFTAPNSREGAAWLKARKK